MTDGLPPERGAEPGRLAGDLLARVPDDGDAASVEHEVLPFLVSLEQTGAGREVDRGLMDAFVSTGSPAAVNAVATIARFARAELSGDASAALARLARRGVGAELEPQLGRLAIGGAWRLDPVGGSTTCFLAFLDRPGQRDPQAWFGMVETADTGGALTGAGWLPPTSLAGLDGFTSELRADWSLAEPQAISAGELRSGLRAAVDRVEALRLDVDAETAAALRLLSIALTGAPDGLGDPEIDAPQPGDFRPAGDNEAEQMIAGFLRDYVAALESIDPIGRSGETVAYVALRWKWERDGDLRAWRAADLDELITALPDELAEAPVHSEDAPACLEALFVVMDERGLLDGPGVSALAAVLERRAVELCEALDEVVDDSPGAVLVREMLADGVDPGDPDAVAAWNASFNARSFADRDAVLGPSLDRRRREAERTARSERRRSRRARQAARRARRRNRR